MPTLPPPDIALRLLGCVDVRRNGVPVSGFRSYKVLALLCYLAIQDKPVLRTALADLFWPALDAEKAGAELRRALNNLGTLLPGCVQADKLNAAFCRNRAGLYSDVAHVNALLSEGTPRARSEFIELTALSQGDRGELMAGFSLADCPEFEIWLTAERERWRHRLAQACSTLIGHLIHQRQHAHAVDVARRAVALDPWCEDAHRQLMVLLARTGQRTAALTQYQQCQAILKAELGVEPDAETTALYERIRAQTDHAHRLAALQAAQYAARETEWIGREEDLARVLGRLDAPEGRLVTVTGPGGVGKTTLAMQVLAERGLADFINGVYFVPLAPISPREYLPTALATAIASAMGLSFTGIDEPKAQLLRMLANRDALLVLDNFEHLNGDSEAGLFVADVLRRAPRVRILVTSRVRLGLPGEWVMELDGLTLPASDTHTYEALLSSGAGQLFLRSASHLQPAFASEAFARDLPAGEIQAIARICRLTLGMPLALEMAASWVRVLSCCEIADEIQRNLDFLESTHSGTPARHRSMRAVFNHSWVLLSEAERAAFAPLSVFRGGFTREAAAQVTGATLTQLLAFMDQSLVRRYSVTGVSPADRFEVHELLRQFAAEKLQTMALPAQLHEAVRTAHSEYYAGWLQERERDLTSSRIRAGCEAVLGELENVRAAWHWAVQQRRGDVLLRMTDALILFYDIRCLFDESERMYGLAVAALSDVGDAVHEANAKPLHAAALGTMLGALAWVRWQRLRYAEARELAERSLALLRPSGDRRHLAQGLFVRAAIAATSGDYANAMIWYQESHAVFSELNDAWGMATTLFSLAQFAVALGQPVVVESYLQQSLAISNRTGDVRSRAFALMALGNKHAEEGQHQAAREELQTALALFEEIQARRNIASAQALLARLLAGLGELDLALHYAQTSLDLCVADQYDLGAALAQHHLSVIATAQGRLDEAWAHGQRSLALAIQSGDLSAMTEANNALAEVGLAAGRWHEAAQFASQARETARTGSFPLGLARAEANLRLVK